MYIAAAQAQVFTQCHEAPFSEPLRSNRSSGILKSGSGVAPDLHLIRTRITFGEVGTDQVSLI